MYSDASDNYIIPDLIVEKIDGKYHVFLNDANLPRLKLSRAYQEIARDKKKFEGESKEFISSKLNSANWMIQAIEQRAPDDAQGHELHRRPAARASRERRAVSSHSRCAKSAEVIKHAESTVESRDEREVRSDAAWRAPTQVLLSSDCRRPPAKTSRRAHQGRSSKSSFGRRSKRPLTDQAIVNILKRRWMFRSRGEPSRSIAISWSPVGAHAKAGMTLPF